MRARRATIVVSVFLASVTVAAPAGAAIIATQKSSSPHAGVTLIEGTTRAPSSKFYATKIALCTKGVRVDATTNPTSFRTVPSFATSTGANVAVNGDFFKAGPMVYGLAVGKGQAWPVAKTGVGSASVGEWYYEDFGWIAFGKDFVEFSHTKAVKARASQLGIKAGYSPTKVVHTFPAGTQALVSGFPELVTEGKQYTCASPTATTCFPDRTDMRSRHPRTAMGLSADRRTFILAVVDGRTATSAGMYGTELAELMKELGAWQAFNLDGGGSSEMWVRGRGTVSKPSDGTSRAVANHWGIYNGTGAPGHCMPLPPPPTGDAGADAGDGEGDGDAGPGDETYGPDPSAPPPNEQAGDDPDDEANAAAAESEVAEDGCSVSRTRAGAPIFLAALAAAVMAWTARTRRLRKRTNQRG